MPPQMGLTEFFAMEASEYLERLDTLVSVRGRPDTSELVRLARALRGSALMAKQMPVAGTAAALENFMRAVDENRRQWDEAARQLAIRAIDDFRIFVRNVASWSAQDDDRAGRLATELDRLAGRSSAQHRLRTSDALDSGTRAFVGREGAGVASALDQAAKALQQNPQAHDALSRVLTIMQPLRGVAALGEMPPIPDILDGIEQAVGELTRRKEPAQDAALVFHAAAKALARATQEVATLGAPDPEAVESEDFARRLRSLLALDRPVVPIEALYFDGEEASHVVREGTRPARPADLDRLELVSHGEHLHKAADDIERARSSTQRDLRAQALAGTFRALSAAAGTAFHEAVSRFALAARDAVAGGAPARDPQAFVRILREAAGILTGAGGGDDAAASRSMERLVAMVHALAQLAAADAAASAAAVAAAPARPPAPSASVAAPAARRPAPAAAPAITSAAPPAPPAAAAPRATPPRGATTGQETPDLAGSMSRYERYVAQLGLGPPSLDELLAGPPADPGKPRAAPAAAPVSAPRPEVPITDLVYRGAAALARAEELRAQVRAQLAGGAPDVAALNELIEEVFDLVALARAGA
jgi:chemotaxis protein histidine kinase CheA